jgi:hypothetical protein
MDQQTLDVLSKFAEQFLLGIAPVLAGFVVAWLGVQIKLLWAKAKAYNPEAVDLLEMIAPMAVKAAEQAKLAGYLDDKKNYAIDLITSWLASKGVTIDAGLISAAIEAAVYDEFNRQKQAPPTEG